MSLSICFISSDYPEPNRPVYTFVKSLVDALADRGNECIVIAPFSITRNKRFHLQNEEYYTSNGNIVKVYRPNVFTLSNFNFFNFRPSSFFIRKAINRALNHLEKKPDVIYGHFWGNALYGYKYSKKNKIPLFVATGESVISLNNKDGKLNEFSHYIKGVICVSTKNKEESIAKGLTIAKKCTIIPNAINPNVFKKMNKQECRKKLGISSDIFITITVGSFNHRKGTQRVASAIDKISDNIYSIFIGEGNDVPNCKNIIFCGKVDNKDIPLYLNAADVFVLPTLHEGCCNAIIEAMACGLPVISSNLPFNWDILNKTNSIMVDPNNVDEISYSLMLLKNNEELCKYLSSGALKSSEKYTLKNRALKIDMFIRSLCDNK